MGVIDRLRTMLEPVPEARSFPSLSWDDYVSMFQFGAFPMLTPSLAGNQEDVTATFAGLTTGAYMSSGPVFSCMVARMLLFSEARFQFQQMRSGRPGDRFGTPELALLERPEPGKTTGDLLAGILTHADLAGNAFIVRRPNRLKLLRPDWTHIVLGSPDRNRNLDPNDVDAEFIGVIYQPGGPGSGLDLETYAATDVAHFAPIRDPLAHYRGLSWITPIIREVMADSAASRFKLKFFENGAVPGTVVKSPPQVTDPVKFNEWIEAFKQKHEGVSNAYRTLYLGFGWDYSVVGANLQEIDFKVTQGAGETRIAAAARVPAVIAGFSEGLQGSSLTTGNYDSAKKQFADLFARPYWRNVAGSLEAIIIPPPGSRLWYDDRDIPFLAENVKDAAEVLAMNITSIGRAVTYGFTRDSAIATVTSGDLTRLELDPKWVSVQLQPGAEPATPTTNGTQPTVPAVPASNGRT